MDEVDGVHRDLPVFESDVEGRARVELARIHRLIEHQIVAVLAQMVIKPLPAMRAGDPAQTAVLDRRAIERDPDGARRQRPDRPIVTVLVPRHLHAVAPRLAEDLAAPEDDVGPDQLLDEVEDGGLTREGEEVAAAAHALAVAALDMHADQTLRPHRGVRRDEAIERRPQTVDPGARQTIARDDDPSVAKALDLVARQTIHGGQPAHRFRISASNAARGSASGG